MFRSGVGLTFDCQIIRIHSTLGAIVFTQFLITNHLLNVCPAPKWFSLYLCTSKSNQKFMLSTRGQFYMCIHVWNRKLHQCG